MDLSQPILVPVGEEIKPKYILPRCPPFFLIVGFWPRGATGFWTILSERFDTQERAEEFAKEKANLGWLKCHVICFEGLKEEETRQSPKADLRE